MEWMSVLHYIFKMDCCYPETPDDAYIPSSFTRTTAARPKKFSFRSSQARSNKILSVCGPSPLHLDELETEYRELMSEMALMDQF